MKKLIILGAGNVGGFLALNQSLFKESFHIYGFLDDDQEKIGKKLWNVPVLGSISDISNYNDFSVAVGIANPVVKKIIINRIGEDLHFPNFISKNTWISKKVTIGKGVIIYPHVSINHETEIKDFVVINMNCAIGHNSTIGRCSSLAPGVNFAGFTHIGENVEVGIGVCTIQGVRIGNNTIIGGQSMLIKDIPNNSKVVGNPGRIL